MSNFFVISSPKEATHLPLLEFTLELFPNENLEDTLLIGVQHIVWSTYSLLASLVKRGLNPSNVYLLGKCYSTNPSVYEFLKSENFRVSPLSQNYEASTAYDQTYHTILKNFINEILNEQNLDKFKRIIILDDGGHLIKLVNEIFPKNAKIVAVEQTSSGYNSIKHCNIEFPIVNVARSNAKTEFETPFLIDLIVERFDFHLKSIPVQINNILIVGGGTIGKYLSKTLANRFKTTTIDIDNKKTDLPYDLLAKELSNHDLIIGCTGTVSIPKELHKFLKKPSVLMSASSSDREFDAYELRKRSGTSTNCHANSCFDDIYLMNSGFPYPFEGSYSVIDRSEFQLTRALLLAAILQVNQFSSTVQGNGFIDLERSIQLSILEKWKILMTS